MVLLSGDRDASVRQMARTVGIPEAEGGLLPEQKVARIRAMQARGEKVAMVGDGINDAPALAAADVGIAVANGTDVAREVAEVFFLEGGLTQVAALLRVARRARRLATGNLAWAFCYNLVAVALAAGGLLRPILAAGLMLASSVVVLWNSSRLHFGDRKL